MSLVTTNTPPAPVTDLPVTDPPAPTDADETKTKMPAPTTPISGPKPPKK